MLTTPLESLIKYVNQPSGTFDKDDVARVAEMFAEDFQSLAREASSSVGRAFCLKHRNEKNEVCTVIIPVRPLESGYDVQLLPTRELIRRVKEFLDGRKLVGTPISVQAPLYKEFDIHLSLVFSLPAEGVQQ